MVRTLHVGIAVLCVWASACDSKPAPHPVWGSEDLRPIVRMLQGKSTVRVHAVELFGREGGGPIRESVVLEVEGDKVIATSKEGERVEGTLRAVSPCQVAIDVAGGKRTEAVHLRAQWQRDVAGHHGRRSEAERRQLVDLFVLRLS
jgi:hypothetical protein